MIAERVPLALDVVHCGDCLEVLRGMPDGCVDAICTDPPYGTLKAPWDTSVDRELFSQCLRVSRGYAVFFYSNTRLWHILGLLHDLGVDTWTLAWHKPNAMGFERRFAPIWVPIVCAHRKGCAFWGQDLHCCAITPHDFDHPTPKPLGVTRWLVRNAVPAGGTVLDPFLGSGTTAVAALLEGRHFIGVEQAPEYVAIAEARIAHAREQLRQEQPALALEPDHAG